MERTEHEGLFFRDDFGDRPVLAPIYSCENSRCMNYTGSLNKMLKALKKIIVR